MSNEDVEVVYVDENNRPIAPPKGMAGSSSSPNFSYPPTGSARQDKGDIIDKIRPDNIIEKIRHNFMGEELINGKWIAIEELKERALTKRGAWDMTNLMLPVSSQNVSLSKLTDQEIRHRTLEIIRTAQRMMLTNWKEYGIKGVDTFEFVHQIIMSNTFITLKQPEEGGIRKLIQGTTHETTSHVSTENPSWLRRRRN